jgi:hypothetical protein
MYWADLSRLGSGALKALGELYQLLTHLGSLGMHAVHAAAATDYKDNRRWRSFDAAVYRTAWCLAFPIPILNLLVLAMALSTIASFLLWTRPDWQPLAAVAMPAILVCAYAAVQLLSRKARSFPVFAAPLLLVAGAVSVATLPVLRNRIPLMFVALTYPILIHAALLGGALFVLRLYDRRRPGALKFGRWAAALLTVLWVVALIVNPHEPYAASLRTVEVLLLALSLSWLFYSGSLIESHVRGLLALRSARKSVEGSDSAAVRDRALRVVWTARLTLSLPALLFLLITIGFWRMLLPFLLETGIEDLLYMPLQAMLSLSTTGEVTIGSLGNQLIAASASPFFVIFLLVTLVSLFLCVWGLLPSILAEIRPPVVDTSSDTPSIGLGTWLTNGFRLMRTGGRLIYATMLLILPLGFLLPLMAVLTGPLPQLEPLEIWSDRTAGYLGRLLTLLGVGLFAVRGRMKALALGFRNVLDVLLDVDNYLRENPHNRNSKSQIFARYASLLRYVAKQDYDRVIIFAHSQGSVISADLLRFIRRERQICGSEYEGALMRLFEEKKDLFLFTFGCPLRQLYSLRFPHLYRWARSTATEMDEGTNDIGVSHSPEASEVGVKLWLNAFRSGDYVGRALWRTDSCKYLHETYRMTDPGPWERGSKFIGRASVDVSGRRREICIGPGAHTHYTDRTAGIIALELDRLIHSSSERKDASHDGAVRVNYGQS